jgi:hypothetical protein
MQDKTLNKCPRCNSDFTCKSESIIDCPCYKIELNSKTQYYLNNTAYGCLCTTCLIELDELNQKAVTIPLPETRGEFIENLHYYLDGNFWVFTEFYHIQRGYCCGNNCKHCAYNKKNTNK